MHVRENVKDLARPGVWSRIWKTPKKKLIFSTNSWEFEVRDIFIDSPAKSSRLHRPSGQPVFQDNTHISIKNTSECVGHWKFYLQF